MKIYHITTTDHWCGTADEPLYRSQSLFDEGFIHCSYAEQLPVVVERYYSGFDKIVILTIETELLASRLVSEPSTGGEFYPHVYGAIDRKSVVDVQERDVNDILTKRR